jgi:small subunit ribosomal protein S9
MAEESKGVVDLDKELASVSQPKTATPIAKKAAAKAPRQKKAGGPAKKKSVIAKGKRKSAVARAALRQGKGMIRINGVDIKLIKPRLIQELMLEPIHVTSLAKSVAAISDIDVNVYGGGSSGQAQAVRTAIAKVLVAASSGDALRRTFMEYDRTLLVDDYRRVEPKKFLGTKARARFQKSYR